MAANCSSDLRVFRKRIVCTFGNVKLPRYDAIKVNCHIRYRQNVDLWHFDLKTNDGDIRGSSTDFRENGSKLFVWLRVFRKRIVCTFGNVKLPRYDAIKVNCHIRYRQNVDLWHFDLKTIMTETSEVVQTILFLNSLRSDEQFAEIFRKIGATLFFYPCTIWIFTFDLKSHITSKVCVASRK